MADSENAWAALGHLDRPADLAARDQAEASVRDDARMISAFRQELTHGHVPDALADGLTREYALKLIDAPQAHDDDEED